MLKSAAKISIPTCNCSGMFFMYCQGACLFYERVAITNSNQEAVLNPVHLTHYSDEDPVLVEDYLGGNGRVSSEKSGNQIEEAMTSAHVDAGRCFNGEQKKSVSPIYSLS